MELNRFNRRVYALTFGMHTIPTMDQIMFIKRMCLNYKQYKLSLRDNGDTLLEIMTVG